jgi:ribosomal-protein-alanine N-acetyltransferase
MMGHGRFMEKIEIKRATIEEFDWTAEMLAGSDPWITLGISKEQCLKACLDPEYLVYVAHLESRPCGAMVLHRRGVAGSPYIKSIAVTAEFRGQGIGAELIDFAENLFRGEARHLFLCVSSFNTRARAFYERLGYRAVGEFQDYILEGASEFLMHKRLR